MNIINSFSESQIHRKKDRMAKKKWAERHFLRIVMSEANASSGVNVEA